MKKILMVLSAMLVSLVLNYRYPCTASAESGIQTITEEIHCLNLINGLYLTDAQKESMIKAAAELAADAENTQKEIKRLEKGFPAVLKELRDTLWRRDVIGEALKEKIRKTTSSVRAVKDKHELAAGVAVTVVKGLLNESQLEVIRNYRPCLIPPDKDGKIGQADFSDHFSNILDKARKIPDSKFWERKDEIIDRLVEKYKNTAPLGEDIDWEKLKKELGAVLEEVRELKDTDFMGLFDKYVDDLKELLPQPDGAPVDKKIEKFLLSDTARRLLAGSLKK